MPSDHILSRYDEELSRLSSTLLAMCALAESQIKAAVRAVERRDPQLAVEVIGDDARIDELEAQVEEQVMLLLALRQPMAGDLREVVSALKIANFLERICDFAANIAKRAVPLAHSTGIRPMQALHRMSQLAQEQIRGVADAYATRDADKAVQVWSADEALDELHTGLFRELLTYMMEDPRSMTAGIHLLFIAKNIERIGDHVTNIAEVVYYLVHGTRLKLTRPKGDRTSSAILLPGFGDDGDY